MGKRRWLGRRRIRIEVVWLVVIAVLILMFLLSSYQRLESIVRIYGEKRCQNLVTQVIFRAVDRAKPEGPLSEIVADHENMVLQMNGEAVQTLQSNVGRLLSDELNALGEQVYRVPLGTVLENVFLIGKGPVISIRYVPVGAAEVRVESAMEAAGINQVLYQAHLVISVEMTVLLPGGTAAQTCTQRILLEETLVTGQVPYVNAG